MTNDLRFRCVTCGESHEMPFAFHTPAPIHWSSVPEAEMGKTAFLGSDDCVIRDSYFVRALIRIPVTDRAEPFEWGVWVSLSEGNYRRTIELWDRRGRESEPAYFGWLCTELAPLYPSTLGLKTMVHTQPVGLRPLVELEATDHPLAEEQRSGIPLARVEEIGRAILHRSDTASG